MNAEPNHSGAAELNVHMDGLSYTELEQCLAQLSREFPAYSFSHKMYAPRVMLGEFSRHCRDLLAKLFETLTTDAELQLILPNQELLPRAIAATNSSSTTGARKTFWQAWQLNLLICSDKRIAKWNYQFRGQNKATDILSFPFFFPLATAENFDQLRGGDLILSMHSWLSNCREYDCNPAEELQRLLLHGLLHLTGLDHNRDEEPSAPKSPMLQYQENLLKKIGQRRAILKR